MKSKETTWEKGWLGYDKGDSVKQVNMECRYLHFEKIKDNEWWLSVVAADHQYINFKIISKKPIECNVEFEEIVAQSFPFVEKKK